VTLKSSRLYFGAIGQSSQCFNNWMIFRGSHGWFQVTIFLNIIMIKIAAKHQFPAIRRIPWVKVSAFQLGKRLRADKQKKIMFVVYFRWYNVIPWKQSISSWKLWIISWCFRIFAMNQVATVTLVKNTTIMIQTCLFRHPIEIISNFILTILQYLLSERLDDGFKSISLCWCRNQSCH